MPQFRVLVTWAPTPDDHAPETTHLVVEADDRRAALVQGRAALRESHPQRAVLSTQAVFIF